MPMDARATSDADSGSSSANVHRVLPPPSIWTESPSPGGGGTGSTGGDGSGKEVTLTDVTPSSNRASVALNHQSSWRLCRDYHHGLGSSLMMASGCHWR
ncbi:hypothetical protein E2562_015630 [Oryza meyeriana var. granulata]|uniref:Uncharacterized protein n=1 Tax=Oryza meyeriana var. granulata TaxID=110450 RepID=A0A6G1EK84_9ORYZ|nr:hypothetical protein E2562_015630 [Oryza meyeriana var. granulata]